MENDSRQPGYVQFFVKTISKYETSTIPKETFASFDERGTHSLKEFHFIDQIANKVKNHYIQLFKS